jgi:ABC-2 type transport system ATP-binding protein
VGLDPRASFMLKEVMRQFCEEGRAVFFSPHVMEVAERLCDRVGIIRKGRLVACIRSKTCRGGRASERGASSNCFWTYRELE